MSGTTAPRPDRAVIDIGSNTVRLVIYVGPSRTPQIWLNESVKARLGRDLAATGEMPAKAVTQALEALARFATILADLGIADVVTVATAAPRDAANGGAFLDAVSALGLEPRLLSGEEEARGAAFGVLGAFPDARGMVADLGGGSLELIEVSEGECRGGVSLPLGTLRLPALRRDPGRLGGVVKRELRAAGWSAKQAGMLYLVGGTWRAFASYAIHAGGYPLSDPHGLCLDVDHARRVAKALEALQPADLEGVPGISANRVPALLDSAPLMRAILAELAPAGVVASSWGLREGMLFQRLPAAGRAQDPLLVQVDHFAGRAGGSARLARAIADWVDRGGAPMRPARLRIASAQLALAAAFIEPNLRARHAFEWAMDKRWVGLAPPQRAWVAVALLASTGRTAWPDELETLASADSLREAVGWGLTVRLARRFAAGSDKTLLASRLEHRGGALVLVTRPERAHLVSPKIVNDLKTLAKWYELSPQIVSVAREPAEQI